MFRKSEKLFTSLLGKKFTFSAKFWGVCSVINAVLLLFKCKIYVSPLIFSCLEFMLKIKKYVPNHSNYICYSKFQINVILCLCCITADLCQSSAKLEGSQSFSSWWLYTSLESCNMCHNVQGRSLSSQQPVGSCPLFTLSNWMLWRVFQNILFISIILTHKSAITDIMFIIYPSLYLCITRILTNKNVNW